MTDDKKNEPAEPAKLWVYKLEDLLVGLSPEMTRNVFECGPNVGREIVD